MQLVSLDGPAGTVSLRLVLEGASCEECVMPRDFLEQIALDILRRSTSGVSSVSIDDPREHAGYVPKEH